MEEIVFVLDGWGKGSAEGTTFRGTPLDPTGEEYKIVANLVRAFMKGWDIVGIWKNKFNSYVIQVKTENVEVNDCGNWDHYYAYLVITAGSLWVSKGLRQLRRSI
jgi:hypothetical protein